MNAKNSKRLIAYFSRPGNNYVGGRIVNLPVGNTEVVAKTIREMTAGDLFRIEAVKPYPEDYYRDHGGGTAGTADECQAGTDRPPGQRGLL